MPFIVHKTLSNRYSSACQSIAVSNGPWRRHHTSLGRHNHFPMKPHPLSRTFHHLHKPVAHRNLLGTSPCLHDRVQHRPWSRGLTIHKLFYIHFDWQSGHLPALTLWPNYHPRRVYHILKGTTWKKNYAGLTNHWATPEKSQSKLTRMNQRKTKNNLENLCKKWQMTMDKENKMYIYKYTMYMSRF